MRSLIRALLEPIRRNGSFDVPTAMAKGRVVSRHVGGAAVRWLITNANDEIQSRQLADGFYELAELEQLREDVGPRQAVLDVGANIGNHCIFFIKRMGCRTLIAVEPFSPALQQLNANLALNLAEPLDIRLAGVALGEGADSAAIVPPSRDNIGLTKLNIGAGDVPVTRGDDLVGSTAIDLIKIDVEGMELAVLSGLFGTIRDCRPAIYIEASRESRDAVVALLASAGYRLVRESRAYGTQYNLTLLPY